MSGPRSAPVQSRHPAGDGWPRRRAGRPASCHARQRPGRLTASRCDDQASHAMAASRATGRCCERVMGGLAAPRRSPRARRGRTGRTGRPCLAARGAITSRVAAPHAGGPRAGGPRRGHALAPSRRAMRPRRVATPGPRQGRHARAARRESCCAASMGAGAARGESDGWGRRAKDRGGGWGRDAHAARVCRGARLRQVGQVGRREGSAGWAAEQTEEEQGWD
jgi:hypothetical protein